MQDSSACQARFSGGSGTLETITAKRTIMRVREAIPGLRASLLPEPVPHFRQTRDKILIGSAVRVFRRIVPQR